MKLFRKKYPSVVFKRPEKFDFKQLNIAVPAKQYFKNLQTLHLYSNIFTHHIINANELNLSISSDLKKIIGIKGKSSHLQTSESHEQLTVMVTISTNGEIFSPLFI